MVQDPYVDLRQRGLEALGQRAVSGGGLCDRTRMVVREDHRRSVVLEHGLHDFARVHGRAVYRADRQRDGGNNAMLVVEKQRPELPFSLPASAVAR